MHTRTTLLVTLVSLLCASMSFAAPTKLSQQGRLLDGDGAPLSGGHGLAFTLHDAETDGNEVWREERVVQFEEGYYSIVLGTVTPLDDLLFAGGTVWMQLSVDGAVLSPRQEVVSVPYALRSAVAEAVEGGTVDADEVAIGGSVVIDSSGNWLGTPTDWSELTGVPADLADGDNDSDTLLGLPCADGYVAKYSTALGAWDCAQDNDSLATLVCLPGDIPVLGPGPGGWVCGTDQDTDTDTQLTEAQVDAFVANNNYSTGAHTVDTDTQLTETQVDAFVANNGYSVGAHTTNTDLLAGLSCIDEDVARWDQALGLWICDTDLVLSEGQVDTFVANNNYSTGPHTTDTDSLADLNCQTGESLEFSANSGWTCASSSSLASAASAALAPGDSLSLNLTAPSPRVLAQGWAESESVSGEWVLLSTSEQVAECDHCGNGSNGVFNVGALTNVSFASGEYNFSQFVLNAGVTLDVTGNQPLIIRSTGVIQIDGTLDLSGEEGDDGCQHVCNTTGGAPGPGGYPGDGVGIPAASPPNDQLPSAWVPTSWYFAWNTDVSQIVGGDGGSLPGNANCNRLWESAWSSGSGGGGALVLIAPTIIINGTIDLSGGPRNDCRFAQGVGSGNCDNYGCGGGPGAGSDGSLWIRASSVQVGATGNVTGVGVLRVDARERQGQLLGQVNYTGFTDGLPSLFVLSQSTPGTVVLKNNSTTTRNAVLTALQ